MPLAGLYAANLWLRTVTRVVVRGAAFPAETFYELERRSARVPWHSFLSPSVPVRLRVTCRKSRLYHSDAVAERVAAAVVRAGGVIASGDAAEGAIEEGDQREQLVVVRLFRDQCQVSFDSSGALLHRRGYRQETAKAPLRETLAAALLLASDWNARGAAARSSVRIGNDCHRGGMDRAPACAGARPIVRVHALARL